MRLVIQGSTLPPKIQQRDRARIRAGNVWGYSLSKDPSRKIGATLVATDDRQSSVGYNGFCRGFPDSNKNWERPRKYDLLIHAEINALSNRSFPAEGATLYCGLKPCYKCLNELVNNKVSRIVWLGTDIDFKEDKPEIWNEIASHYVHVMGGMLIEYHKEPLDYNLEQLFNIEHDKYGYIDNVIAHTGSEANKIE